MTGRSETSPSNHEPLYVISKGNVVGVNVIIKSVVGEEKEAFADSGASWMMMAVVLPK